MSENLFSQNWYRVAELTPRLRSHAHIHRQRYRGQTWYVLQDLSTERFHRFSPDAYFVIGLMDGKRTVQELWELATERLGDDAPTQEQMIQMLGQLHAADVLQCDVPPDTAELFRRGQKQRTKRWQGRLFSVFSWRFPLFDPERLLQKLFPFARPFMGWGGAFLWIIVVTPAVVLAGMHWPGLTEGILDRVLTPQNLLLIWLLFPVLKLLHELGHGLAVKAFKGEVHDMGIIILVLTPVPYVDASTAWSLRERWQRIAVGAAGMLVEVFIAALAMFIWVAVEPGTVRTLAYNTMIISGVSTILFNANPLLRFDGYYIFSDLIEIPNLRQRSNTYLGYLCERYLFGSKDANPQQATGGERAWFVSYGISAFFYRIFIVVAIVLFLLDELFLAGVILGLFAAVMWVVVPLVKGLSFLFTNPRIRRVRVRAVAVTTAAVALITAGLVFVPVPFRTIAEGVIWIPDEAFVRAGTEGFVERVVAEPGSQVRPGDVLILCKDPILSKEVKTLEGRYRELEARYREEFSSDRAKAAMIREELQYTVKELARARERKRELVIKSQVDGTFVAPFALDLPGRFVRRGEHLAYVVELDTIKVRAVISQADIDLVQDRTVQVDARLAESLDQTTPAVVKRIVPAASEDLPTSALGSEGGGELALDPTEGDGSKAMQTVFQVDLDLPNQSELVSLGGRVYLRFDHGQEPLAAQWARAIRQLFLSRFNV